MVVIKKRRDGEYGVLHPVVFSPRCTCCGSELSEQNKGLYVPLVVRSALFKTLGCEKCFRCHAMSEDGEK